MKTPSHGSGCRAGKTDLYSGLKRMSHATMPCMTAMSPPPSSTAAHRLLSLLDGWRVKAREGGCEKTHTSMGGAGGPGSFYVPGVGHDALINAWGVTLDEGGTSELPALVERHRHIGPVLVDIDLRQEGPSRLYSTADVDAFVATLFRELGALVDLGDPLCFVLEKAAPRPAKGGTSPSGGVFKDGFHLVVPSVVTRPELQVSLRSAMLPHVAELFASTTFLNAAEDIYDEAVIERNGWLMYGAKKPGEPYAWTVTRVLGKDAEKLWATAESDSGEYMPASQFAGLLSIRRHDVDPAPLTVAGREAVDRVLAERAEAEARREAAFGTAEAPAGIDASRLGTLVAMLSPQRAGPYAT